MIHNNYKENTISLTRVAMEGPVASTKDSFGLSKAALEKWPSHLGERCTTAGWIPEVISKTVSKIQSGKRLEEIELHYLIMC